MSQVNTVHLQAQYRPIKVGWCIESGNTASIVKASQLSYSLWGGIFNPIIPIDNKKLADYLIKLFKVDILYNIDNSDIVKNFIGSYDYLPWPFDYDTIIYKSFRGWQSILLDIEVTAKTFSEGKKTKSLGLLDPLLKPRLNIYNWDEADELNTFLTISLGKLSGLHHHRDYNEILNYFFKVDYTEILKDSGEIPVPHNTFSLTNFNEYNILSTFYPRENIP